ncbi:melanocyte-stimulating hormone receptor-like [Oculina patagonica]
MANLTENQNPMIIKDFICRTDLFQTHQKIVYLILNIPLSITAFLGNILIIVALQKPSSLHPPSKLLLGCLAITDLCVGLISQPLSVTHLLSKENSRSCYYLAITSIFIGVTLGGLSLLTLTAISVDRLLALMLGLRYRQIVTLRRVWILVIAFGITSSASAITFIYNPRITAGIAGVAVFLCAAASTFCYTKIYSILRHHQATVQDHIHQGQSHGGESPLNIARYRKTVSSALWVQITLVACYLPFGIVETILSISVTPSAITAYAFTLSLLYLNSSLNPFLYCWKIREVRQAVKDTIRQVWCF